MTAAVQVVARLLLAGTVVVSAAAVPHRLDQLRETERGGHLPRIDEIASLAGVRPEATEFLAHVRAVVPSRARVELVVPVPADTGPDHPHTYCGRPVSNSRYYWYTYLLLPRPITCGQADVILYIGVRPGDSPVRPPTGARVQEFSPGYVLVDVAGVIR